MLFPTIELRGAPLWGFTYRLLIDWLHPAGEARPDGPAAAGMILDFVLSQGLKLRASWSACGGVQVAEVSGRIPAAAVLTRFAGMGPHVAAINTLEVQPEFVRLLGPDWEEYRIRAI